MSRRPPRRSAGRLAALLPALVLLAVLATGEAGSSGGAGAAPLVDITVLRADR